MRFACEKSETLFRLLNCLEQKAEANATIYRKRNVLSELFRDQSDASNAEEQLGLAKELVALFKSGFRSEEELKAMARSSSFLNDHNA